MASVKPPFTEETARQKVKAAQAAWNTRDPDVCVKAYSTDSVWRNRALFLHGHDDIRAFLTAKWQRELDYRLRKELFAFSDDRIAVQFWYEYRDAEEVKKGNEVWRRAYGLEDWTFDAEGKMRKRMMSANDVEIGPGKEGGERWFAGEIGPDEDVNSFVDRVDISEKHW